MITKLGDMVLTPSEERALRRLIAAHITPEDRAAEEAEQAERAERAERDELWRERLQKLARATARADGATTIGAYRQAQAAWEAFAACEGYHSPFSVDERFDPEGDRWADAWVSAYTDELERIHRR